ncbi:MAG TPA: ABC transporter substrate-binding protein [Geminicoccaceae bacterium]
MKDDPGADRGRVDRRTALRLAGGGAAFLGAPAILRAQAPFEITFSFGPDDSGSLRNLIDAFNRAHEGRIRVSWREMARSTDDYFRQLVSDFEVDSSEIDVIGADVIWTAELVARGWVRDLTDRVTDAFDPRAFLPAAINSVYWQNRIWAVPWFTAAGMLYYRKDLVEQAGFAAPPATLDELTAMARKVMDESGTRHGYVFQGAEYEGGVTNALEFIWNAGGRVLTSNISVAATRGMGMLDPNVVVVDSADSARGLDAARKLVADGIAPEEVVDFTEEECFRAFLAGDAVFMRNWPFVYGLIDEAEISKLGPDQVGIAPLPAIGEYGRSYSCLGGWNLMISENSRNPTAAWEFIRFAADPDRQKQRALEGGFLPTVQALYDDAEIRQQVPVVELGRAAIENARVRPVSPVYSKVSPRLARAFQRVLKGEIDGAEAVETLQRELRVVLRRYR